MLRGVLHLTVLALVASAFGDARELRSTSAFCLTESKATLILTNGRGFAYSSSYCKAEAEARNAIYRVVTEWVELTQSKPDSGCIVTSASTVAEGFAEAAAHAFASVNAVAEIEGTGTACAEGFAAGDALATALVDIAVEVTLKVVEEEYGSDAKDKVEDGLDKVVNEATGEAVGRAVASVISSAWASAYQSVCTKGELVEGFDSSFARQVREAAAYLFAEVSVSLCEEKEDEYDADEVRVTADSTSYVTGEVTFEDDSEVVGDAEVGGENPELCTGMKHTICCRKSYKSRSMCRCGTSCLMKSYLSYSDSEAKLWEDMATGEKCICL